MNSRMVGYFFFRALDGALQAQAIVSKKLGAQKTRVIFRMSAIVFLFSTVLFQTVVAQIAPPLGTAGNFAVLGSSPVTNTGPTIVTADVGASRGTRSQAFVRGLWLERYARTTRSRLRLIMTPPLRSMLSQASRATPS